MTEQKNNVHESILIGKLLSATAYGVTVSLEKFSGWLLAGFGAAFTLILSNIDSISKFITTEDIKNGVVFYLIALAAGVLQRWLASSIQASAMVSKEAEELGKNAAGQFDPENIFSEIEKATFYPQKWLVQFQFNKVRNGDFAAPGRMQVTMTQIQGFLVLIQGILVISSIVVIIRGLST